MRLLSLYLRHFRNYEELFIPFHPKINLILGENGEGKTNLLEALFLFITGRSWRTSKLKDLIMFGKNSFYLELHFLKNGVEESLKINVDESCRKIVHNSTTLPHISSLFGILLGTLFSPLDYDLIVANPSLRRQFLDLHIVQTNPLYLRHLSSYIKAMRERNVLLKKHNEKEITIFEEMMALSAAYITKEREKTIKELNALANPLQSFLSQNKDRLYLSYRSCCKGASDIAAFYKEQYQNQREKEFLLGYTLLGPHKDDLSIFLGEKEARFFGSEGEIRSTALSLRLSQLERWRKIEAAPLFFLDDVCMGLDLEREKAFFSYLSTLDQVFVTSPRPLPVEGHQIWVKQGALF